MPICPKCFGKIDSLHNYASGERKTRVSIFDGEEEYEEEEFQADGKVDDYECPNCSEVLFKDEEKAIAFLKNKDELQEIMAEKLNKIKEKNEQTNKKISTSNN